MGKQVAFFEKNFLDFDNESATITATQGDEFAKYIRSRSLQNAWLTTGSVDADQPVLDFDLSSTFNIDRIILIDHNFKAYEIEQFDFDAGTWSQIHTQSNDLKSTTEITFTEFYAQRLRIRVLSTKVANQEKRLNRIIVTKKIGSFSHWPKIENPTIDQGKVIRTTLSGKKSILRTVGAYSVKLTLGHWRKKEDLELVEKLYRQSQGFQVWLSGGDEAQFFFASEGVRAKDFYLMGFQNDYQPKIKESIYVNGLDLSLDLVEVVR